MTDADRLAALALADEYLKDGRIAPLAAPSRIVPAFALWLAVRGVRLADAPPRDPSEAAAEMERLIRGHNEYNRVNQLLTAENDRVALGRDIIALLVKGVESVAASTPEMEEKEARAVVTMLRAASGVHLVIPRRPPVDR